MENDKKKKDETRIQASRVEIFPHHNIENKKRQNQK